MLAALAIASLALVTRDADTTSEKYWPQWRGPHATGVSKTADPPTEWSETKNIRWKVEIPGRGSASPVIWGDKVFVLSAVPVGVEIAASHQPRGGIRPRVAAQVRRHGDRPQDRQDRRGSRRRASTRRTRASHQQFGTYASSSAITDGERVYAFFDSFGLYAYDMNGKLLWEKDLGDKKMRNEFGEGQTPVLHGNRIVVQWDHQGPSFITALDKVTGKEIWRTDRQEIDSWGTPLVVEHGGARAGDRRGDEQGHQLRPRDRQGRLGGAGADDEPDPVVGVRGRHGLRRQRLPRQQAARDPARRGEG